MKLGMSVTKIICLMLILCTTSKIFAQQTPSLTFRNVQECQSFATSSQFISLSGTILAGGRFEFVTLNGNAQISGTCSNSVLSSVPNRASLESLRNHVADLNQNQVSSTSIIEQLNLSLIHI